jgi:hypothetical protein
MGILLFNWLGYRLLTNILEERASLRLEARLDRQQYDESQLISIKVPVTHLAYYNTSAGFERTNGTIEVNGIPYNYVKCRLYNDSLEMLCIPNAVKLKLRHTDPDSHPYVYKTYDSDPFVCSKLPEIVEPHYTLIQHDYRYLTVLTSLTLPTALRPPAPRQNA